VAHDGMDREPGANRLLDKVPLLQPIERRARGRSGARQFGERASTHVVAVDVRENSKHSAAHRAKASPCPIDEQRNLRQVVLVLDDSRLADAVRSEKPRQLADGGCSRRHQGARDVERERVPPQETGQRGYGRKSTSAGNDEGCGDREDENTGQQAAPSGHDEGRRRRRERLEETSESVVVLMVVEDDEALTAARKKSLQLGDQPRAFARGADVVSKHLDERAEVPCADAQPVNAAIEAARQTMPQGARQHRFAAATRADESKARRRSRFNRAREGRELRCASLEPVRRRGKVAARRHAAPR